MKLPKMSPGDKSENWPVKRDHDKRFVVACFVTRAPNTHEMLTIAVVQ